MEKTALPINPLLGVAKAFAKKSPEMWAAFKAAYKPMAGQAAEATSKATKGGFGKLINPLMNVGFVGMGMHEGAQIGKASRPTARSMELPEYNASRLQNVY